MDTTIFDSAADFRDWLEENHDKATELWIGYYKKGVPKKAMTYLEGVEEALCFGWIDGLTRRVDEEVTATRFTPRRRTSNWSATNIARVAALTAAGRMHPAGLRAFEQRDRRKDTIYSVQRVAELPPDLIERFRLEADAWAFWESRPPGYRRAAAYWILSAKRPETRERRFATLLDESAGGRLPAPFLVTREQRGKEPTKPDR
jgi:uncharacterized protein YdeI (YjbR/CyaY-like superfamily)